MKKKYVIDCCTFLPQSGGIVALHKLCHDLNSLGEEAYITSPITHQKLNAPFVSDRKFSKDEIIVIYPEVNLGNPHKANHVVRWVLNTPPRGENGNLDFYNTKNENDLIFIYCDYFKVLDDSRVDGMLNTIFIDTNYFYNSNKPRTGSAFLVKKGGMKSKIHQDDSIDLSNYVSNWTNVANIFRNVEYFYCYDNACFWAFLASLCGCIPIVIPDSDMKFEEWSTKFYHMKYGVAYGLDHINHAKATQHLLSQTVDNINKNSLNSVKNFISVCNQRFS